MAGSSVIQATGTVEFEDDLRMGDLDGALGAAASILESIPNPPGGKGWSWVGCGCHEDPILDKITTYLHPCIGDIKFQLLCGVRIEPA